MRRKAHYRHLHRMLMRLRLLLMALILLAWLEASSAFVPPELYCCSKNWISNNNRPGSFLGAASGNEPRKKTFTVKDLQEEMKKRPADFEKNGPAPAPTKKGKHRRQRKRVDNPQQQYLYAAQRKALEREGKLPTKNSGGIGGTTSVVTGEEMDRGQDDGAPPDKVSTFDFPLPICLAKEYGLSNPTAQHCDPLVDDVKPEILGKIRVGGDIMSGSYVYVINKPPGWAILGSTPNSKKKTKELESIVEHQPRLNTKATTTKLEIKSAGGDIDVLEYTESDLLAVMTPEEIEEFKKDASATSALQGKTSRTIVVEEDSEDDFDIDIEELDLTDDELDLLNDEDAVFDELEMLALMSPDELTGYEKEVGPLPEEFQSRKRVKRADVAGINASRNAPGNNLDTKTDEVLSKIGARKTAAKSDKASLETVARPSVVAWLKEHKAQEGTPIRGGNFWTGLAGATNVDDSGIVILCPKEQVDNVFIDYLEYVAVVGNSQFLAPKQKGSDSLAKEEMILENLSVVRRGRGEDTVQTVKVVVQEVLSSCNSIVEVCQQQFQDGIRGDPAGNPLSRLASRRLIHCNGVSISSLTYDETVEVATECMPDDIAILAERRNQHEYKQGSFLGRYSLRNNPFTNAYREINGAADGFPGWTVDRYDKWLFVEHDEKLPRGPLPSIHDGNTAGVYYLSASPDRSAMGSSPTDAVRPQLLEGQPAPDAVPILENGVIYHVSLDKDLSTGLFLDQRPQRAWLARNCNQNTHILNCFAHCGGFSIAAASAGASTTSIDLSKKWLDRIQPQMAANGIDFDIRHDCIYGDCFDWLAKLAKRGEKYDIVILDPPSTSVSGRKKKRWSIKNDMPELVSLAARTVKSGGLLWTTTNSATLSATRFARLCRKGLEEAGLDSAKLERIQPMPHDFPSVGPQPVKNFVWRIP